MITSSHSSAGPQGPVRFVVLVSGRGSNLRALHAAVLAGECGPAQIVGVVSNDPKAAALDWSREQGLPTACVAHREFASRESFDAELLRVVQNMAPDFVLLAGFMRILTPVFIAPWAGRLINIHPSLLPAFPGLNTHARALEAGVALHGCTVHAVIPELDAGPILAQAVVPVLDQDSPETLADRVLAAEHRLYPAVVRALALRQLQLDQGRVKLPSVGSRLLLSGFQDLHAFQTGPSVA